MAMSTLFPSSYEQCALVTESATNVLKDYYANTSIDTSLSLHGRIDLCVLVYQVNIMFNVVMWIEVQSFVY